MSLLRLSAAALGAAVLFAAACAQADDWPTRPIRVISPFAAGSASDTVSRVVLDRVGNAEVGVAEDLQHPPADRRGGELAGLAGRRTNQ